MSIEATENSDLHRFIVRVDFEITDLGEYEKHCVVRAENATQAKIMVNKFLLSHLYFEHFPDSFFANLEIADSYHIKEDLEDNAEVYALLKAYEQEHGKIPVYEGSIYLGNLPEKKAYPYLPKPLSDSEYSVLSEFMLLNDAKDLDTFI